MLDTKDTDRELWQTWKKSPTDANLSALFRQVRPLIQREVNRWSKQVAPFILENQAKALTLKAFESYNPNMGTALSTHVVNALMKLSRTAYQNQTVLNVPESQRITFNQYTTTVNHLENINGTKPTLQDVADYMALPPKQLQRIVENAGVREFIESAEGPLVVKDMPEDLIHLAFYDMTPLQKEIFKLRTGYDHSPVKNAQQIMADLKINQSQLSYQLGLIKTILARAQSRR